MQEFGAQNVSDPKLLWAQNLFWNQNGIDPRFFNPYIFGIQIFGWNQILIRYEICMYQTSFCLHNILKISILLRYQHCQYLTLLRY